MNSKKKKVKETERVSLQAPLIVNFMCQHDWVAGCPITVNIILGMSVRVSLEESSMQICMNEADCPPLCGEASSKTVEA